MAAPALMLRLGCLAASAGACLYAALVLVAWPQPAALERAAARIVVGDRYKWEELDRLSGFAAAIAAAPFVRASSQRAAALISLRRAEEAIAEGRRIDIDAELSALARLLPAALAAVPADALLWLASFWRDNVSLGFEESRLPLLSMSYVTGPNEGWVGVKRNVVALTLWARLTPVLQHAATAEFAGLVHSRFREMPDILTGPGWAARNALLPSLAKVDVNLRREFARTLSRAGVDVEVPGIESPSIRPWIR